MEAMRGELVVGNQWVMVEERVMEEEKKSGTGIAFR
jgi:hypothetical protein